MHTILVNKDNSLTTSISKRIIKGSSNIDYMHILVDPFYGELDMRSLTAILIYITPYTNTRNTITLIPSEELYKEKKLEYKIMLDESFTSEAGDIRIFMLFMNEGNTIRKTTMGVIKIYPEQDSDTEVNPNKPSTTSIPDNIYLDTATNEIYLTSNGSVVGDKISVGELSETIIETTANEGLVKMIT